jgi:hypothetical protein
VIECHGKDACIDQSVACPNDMQCRIECLGEASCKAATLSCNPTHSCDIVCDGKQSCADTSFVCGAGVCEVLCDGSPNDTCKHAQMTCGTDDSTITCNHQNDDVVVLDPSLDCACEGLDC